MKKYIVMFLPVKGEIGIGNHFLSAWRKEYKFYWYPKVTSMTDTHYIWDNQPYHKDDAISKVELFVCTHDIQVGDEFYFKRELDVHIAVAGDHDSRYWIQADNKELYSKDHCFKVVGKPSPEAIWINPGDKFDEDEVKLGIGKMNKEKFLFAQFDNDVERKYWFPNNGWELYLQIKGPCGRFH